MVITSVCNDGEAGAPDVDASEVHSHFSEASSNVNLSRVAYGDIIDLLLPLTANLPEYQIHTANVSTAAKLQVTDAIIIMAHTVFHMMVNMFAFEVYAADVDAN